MGAIFGACVGLVIAAIILLICNKNGKMKTEYDERQEAIRGRGYKYAAITGWAIAGFFGAASLGDLVIPMDDALKYFTILFASILVQTSHAIWNDAYYGSNNNVKKYFIVSVVLTVINGGISIVAGMQHELIVDGFMTWKCINVECTLLFVGIALMFVVKAIFKKDDVEEED